MPPQLEGTAVEVVVLSDQFVVESQGVSLKSKGKGQESKVRLTFDP